MFITQHKFKGNNIEAEFNPSVPEHSKEEVEATMNGYDWYYMYIDDGTQYKMAIGRNEKIKEILKNDFGCIRFELVKEDGSIEQKVI